MSTPVNLAIVDDHPLVRECLRRYLTEIGGYNVVATGGDAQEAIALCSRSKPDLLLLDVEMPGRDALAAMADIRSVSPRTRIVIFTAYCRDPIIEAAIRAGADGFLLKSDPADAVCAALTRILQGERVYSKDVAARVAMQAESAGTRGPAVTPLATLHPRELEVLRYIGKGMANAEMASTMHISIRTVERHVLRLMRHLQIGERTKLTALAHASGLVN